MLLPPPRSLFKKLPLPSKDKQKVVLSYSTALYNFNLTIHGVQTMHCLDLGSSVLYCVERFIPSSSLLQLSPSSYQV